MPAVRQSPGSSCEMQDEDFEGDSVNVMRYESVVVRTIESASVVEQTSSSSEIVSGQVTRSVKIQSQFENEVMITELQDEYEEEAEPSSNVAGLASGDYNAPSSESMATAVNVDTPDETHVKIVDYSFHESSFEGTPAPKKRSGKNNEESVGIGSDIVIPLRPSLELESHSMEGSPLRERQELGQKGSDTTDSLSSGSHLPQDDVSQEQSTQSSNQSELRVVIEEAASLRIALFTISFRSLHAHKHEIPPLSMSLRSRTPHGTSDDAASDDLASQRRSPARSRKAAKEVDVEALKTPPRPSKEADEEELPGTTTPTRTLRPRTPSRARQQEVATTPSSKTPRRSRKASESSTASENVTEVGATRKSPSRATRARRLSTMEEEPATSSRKSPSRRTPSRITASASKSVQETGPEVAKTRSHSRAAKSLQKKFEVISNPLGNIDVRSMYDVWQTLRNVLLSSEVAEGEHDQVQCSNSEVPDIKAKKLKTVQPEETIAEVDEETEETGPVRSQGRRKVASQSGEGPSSVLPSSASRTRRASSATIVEASPARRRRTSGSSVSSAGTTSTPKSPSRRGRPRNIETIPE
ncbi:hypothetical protein ANCCAN_19731 [Ancylostoma caninum]|uniref:Uncharacterized protein n=1 Tax=Ancylostoma caninum TaxID=29170 RepID=A0A368FQI7_ANCCA|nr:hypothetical protein ANCCAN_19731 [Ancylostoma caninum]